MDADLYKKELKNIELIIKNINEINFLKSLTVAARAKTAHSSFEKMYVAVGDTGSWILNLYNHMFIWFLIIFPWDFALYWGMLIAAFNNFFKINFTEISCHDEHKEKVLEKVIEKVIVIPEKVSAVAEKIPEESSIWDTVYCILNTPMCIQGKILGEVVKYTVESAKEKATETVVKKTKIVKEVEQYTEQYTEHICIDIVPQWTEYAPQLMIVALLITMYIITSYTMKKFVLFRINNQKKRLEEMFKEREIE